MLPVMDSNMFTCILYVLLISAISKLAGGTNDTFLVYTDLRHGTVYTMSLGGKTIEICLPQNTFRQPHGITHDPDANVVYLTDDGPNAVYSLRLDGKSESQLVLEIGLNAWLYGIAYDGEGHLFVTDNWNRAFYRLNVDGTGLTTWLTEITALDIVVDTQGRYLIWGEYNGNTIERASIDDPSSREVLIANTLTPFGISMDITARRIYWCEHYNGRILSMNIDGNDLRFVSRMVPGDLLRHIRGFGGHLYLTTSRTTNEGDVYMVYDILENGTQTEIFSSLTAWPFAVIVLHGNVPANVCYVTCKNGGALNVTSRTCICINEWTGPECDEKEIGSTTDQVIQNSTLIALPSEEPVSTNDPYITNARPNYGPKAGGTTLTLHGHNLLLVSSVNLGDDMVCYTLYRNDTLLKVVTPKLWFNQTGVIGESLSIKLVNNSTVKFDLSHVFVYKENPKIKAVFPLETIRKGGTKLTVLGSNFDSVSVITMVTTMTLKRLVDEKARVYNETRTIYTTMCSFINSTQLICFTPKFELLPEIVFESSRKQRDIPRNEDDNALPIAKFQKGARPMQQSDTLKTVLKAELRARRSTKVEFSNGGDLLEFHIGFNLDGVNEYKNYSKIDVYIEPQFHLDQRVWKYSKSKPIHFQGEHLDVGLTVYDYRITVGSEPCHQLELLSNELSCYPPVVKPELQNENHMEHPRIKIHVGLHITHTAGYLNYQDDTLPLYAIILAAVIPACVVIMIVVLIIVCVKKRQKIG